MKHLPVSDLPLVEEKEAVGEIAEKYDEIRRVMETPFVPNIHKATATAPNVLAGTWGAFRSVLLETTLPRPLVSMILYSIAAAKNCQYCSSVHRVTCSSLGVDEETLAALHDDLEALTPERVQAILIFARRCALDPQALSASDYDAVRDQGVTDQELVEIIALAALGNYLDTLADAMKIEVDEFFIEALRE